MTTAERFATTNSSYWNEILPRLDHFVRISNLGPRHLGPPVASRLPAERQALVSETGFLLGVAGIKSQTLSDGEAEVMAGVRLSSYTMPNAVVERLTEPEWRVVRLISRRLKDYCMATRSFMDVEIEPQLAGCGVVSGGVPDIMALEVRDGRIIKTIVEVKGVERTFRSTDFRQLATYAVLYFAQHNRLPDALAIVNPVRGTAIEVGVDEFFHDVAGLPADEAIQSAMVDWSSFGMSG